MATGGPRRFSRLSSTNVAFQVHVREDARYAILPIMQPTDIKGWTVYDTLTGTIVTHEPFVSFTDAKNWLNAERTS